MCSAHPLTERNIWVKLNKNPKKGSGGMELTPNSRVNPLTLNFSLGSWVMCSAHRLTKRNNCVKFNEVRSKSLGDMERTQNEG